MTMTSVFLLFLIGNFCLKVRDSLNALSSPSGVWGLLGYTFIFLAFDDWLRIHETIDHTIHKIFAIKETELTDHLDDLILIMYGITVAVIVWRNRRLLFQFLPALKYFLIAVPIAVGHCVLDVVVGSRSLMRPFVSSEAGLETLIIYGEIFEETLKLYAEVFLLGTVICCFVLVRDKFKQNAL